MLYCHAQSSSARSSFILPCPVLYSLIQFYAGISSLVLGFSVSVACLLVELLPILLILQQAYAGSAILAPHHLPAKPILYRLIKFYTALPNPLMPDPAFYCHAQSSTAWSSFMLAYPLLYWVIQSQSHLCLLRICSSCSSFHSRFMLARSILAPHGLPAKPILYWLFKLYSRSLSQSFTACSSFVLAYPVWYWLFQSQTWLFSLSRMFACWVLPFLFVLLQDYAG